MKSISMNIFMSQIGRFPSKKVKELPEKYMKSLEKMSIVNVNQLFSWIECKMGIVNAWKENTELEDLLTYKMIATKTPLLTQSVFEEIDNLNKLPSPIQIELASELSETELINLLNNFGSKLDSLVIQNFILALSEYNQKTMLIKFKDEILKDEVCTFIAVLNPRIQKQFLKMIADYINNLEPDDLANLISFLTGENLEFFLKFYRECLNKLSVKNIIDVMALLGSANGFIFIANLGDKLNEVPANILSYQLSLISVDSHDLYDFWTTKDSKAEELSETGFSLLFHKLEEQDKIKAITKFKGAISEFGPESLLDLLEHDSDQVIAECFKTCSDVISKATGEDFIVFVKNNVKDEEIRNQIFFQYKDYLSSLDDNTFIYFINVFLEINISYEYATDDKRNKFFKDFLDSFEERLKSVSIENLPSLFSVSGQYLSETYIFVLKDNIVKLITEKKYIKEFLKNIDNSISAKLLENFEEQFKELNASEWWDLLDFLDYHYVDSTLKKILLECDIDNFDFIQQKNMPRYIFLECFSCLEKNAQEKLVSKYKSFSDSELIDVCKKLVDKVLLEDNNNCLINYDCLTLLCLFKMLLEKKIISDEDKDYLSFKEFYTTKIFEKLYMEDSKNCKLIKDMVFYRLVKGSIKPSMLLSVRKLKELIFFNKVCVKDEECNDINVYKSDEIEPLTELLTEEQVINLNYKLFKKMCKFVQSTITGFQSNNSIRNLAIRLYLTIGYYNAKRIINLGYMYTEYEYLFSNIDLKKIILDQNGEPIINKKLNDFLFSSSLKDKSTNMNRLLNNEIPDFEKIFAKVYNNWELIYASLNGNVTISRILDFFEENVALLNPNEYRLNEVISEFGNDKAVIEIARKLYETMRLREYSSIPKVKGNFNEEYNYEILDLDDPLGLVVGYITRCCFLINGLSNNSLVYSATSNKSRIFVVRKNGELIAQSWVWRYGNIVCFDNVESRGSYDRSVLLEIYQKAALELLTISQKEEDLKEQIKLVTVGYSHKSLKMPNEKVPLGKIVTPTNGNEKLYTDANEQWILASTSEGRELYYGDVKIKYKDERKALVRYKNLKDCEDHEKDMICKKIMAIEFAKSKKICSLNLTDYAFVSFCEDWYILVDWNGNIIYNILDNDERAKEELFSELSKLETIFAEMKIDVDSEKLKNQSLVLIKGDE